MKRGIQTMSTDFRPGRLIAAADLFGGRLEKHGVREKIFLPTEWPAEQGFKLPPLARVRMRRTRDEVKAQFETVLLPDMPEKFAQMVKMIDDPIPGIPFTTECFRCLTDGTNYIWVEISNRGFVASITRNGDAQTILEAIAQEFDTDIIGEHDAEFWENYEDEDVATDTSDWRGFDPKAI
jgi:hypothetical protein